MIKGSKDAQNQSIGGLGSARGGVWWRFLRFGPPNVKILEFCLIKFYDKIFTLWGPYLKILNQTPPRAEPRPPNESLLRTFWALDDPLTHRPLVCGSLFWSPKGVIFENFSSVDLPKRRCVGRNSWSCGMNNSSNSRQNQSIGGHGSPLWGVLKWFLRYWQSLFLV